MRIKLATALRTRLSDWAREKYPEEACGLLLGKANSEELHVMEVTRARNLERKRPRDRFALDPEDQLVADQWAQAAGIEVVGVWHTHPDHPARPSETDRAQAWEAWSYVILSVAATGVTDLRSWRLDGTDFAPEEVVL